MCVARILSVCILFVCFAVTPSLASDTFHVNYRHDNVSSDGSTISGFLLLNVYNTSGEDARDLEIWIDGPNKVTFDNHRIFLGSLAHGQQIEVLDKIDAYGELTDSDQNNKQVNWTLEYTDSSGKRVRVNITGLTVL